MGPLQRAPGLLPTAFSQDPPRIRRQVSVPPPNGPRPIPRTQSLLAGRSALGSTAVVQCAAGDDRCTFVCRRTACCPIRLDSAAVDPHTAGGGKCALKTAAKRSSSCNPECGLCRDPTV